MTDPLTPREKVAEIVDPLVFELAAALDNAEGEPAALRRDATEMRDMRMREAFSKADAILTALASGSGDHAELILMANAALEIYSDDVLVVGGTRRIHADNIILYVKNGVDALIAENAALRAERDEWRNTVRFNERCWSEERGVMIDRATEAERKLAEAEETSTRWAIRFAELRKAAGIGVKPMLSDVPGELRKMRSLIDRAAELMQQCTDPERFEGSSTLNVYANMRAWLYDLSKEAERG